MPFEDMEFWEQERNGRLTAADRTGGPVGHYEGPAGGVMWVAGQFLINADQARMLDLDGAEGQRRGFDQISVPWLDPSLLLFTAGGGEDWTFLDIINGIRGELAALGVADPAVAPHYLLSGEMKGTVPRGGPASSPWVAGAVQPPNSWGTGISRVAIIDTGIDSGASWSSSITHSAEDVDPLLVPGGPAGSLGSQAGHGTFIASLVERMSGAGVRLRAVRVLDVDGIGSEVDVVKGLHDLRLEQPEGLFVVNMSLGGFTDDGGWTSEQDAKNPVFPSTAKDRMPLGLAAELSNWAGRGAVFVAAAGNDGQHREFWPAALADPSREPGLVRPTFVAVGSVQRTLEPSTFTNTGTWVSVSTLGEDLVSDYPLGAFPLTPTYSEEFTVRAARWSGTSFAAPVVTAELVRRVTEDPANPITPDEAWKALWSTLPPVLPGGPEIGRVWDPRTGVSGPPRDPRLP